MEAHRAGQARRLATAILLKVGGESGDLLTGRVAGQVKDFEAPGQIIAAGGLARHLKYGRPDSLKGLALGAIVLAQL
jgi:hypothetical protein